MPTPLFSAKVKPSVYFREIPTPEIREDVPAAVIAEDYSTKCLKDQKGCRPKNVVMDEILRRLQ